MDVLSFVAALVKALAWPGVVMTAIFIFKDSVLDLVPAIRKLKIAGVELQIKREVNEAVDLTPSDKFYQSNIEDEVSDSLGKIDPEYAIIEAWRAVETAGRKLIGKRHEELPSTLKTNMSLPEALRNLRLITSEQFIRMTKLRKIRNEAVHTSGIRLELPVVKDYVRSALALAAELNRQD